MHRVCSHSSLPWWCGSRCTTTQPYPGGVDRGVRPHNPTLVVWIEVYDHTTLPLVVWIEVYDHTTLPWWCGSRCTTTQPYPWWCGSRCTTTQPYPGGVDRGVRPHNPTLVVWIEVYDHTTLPWWCGSRCTTTQPYPGGVDRGVRPHNLTLVVWVEVYDNTTLPWWCGSNYIIDWIFKTVGDGMNKNAKTMQLPPPPRIRLFRPKGGKARPTGKAVMFSTCDNRCLQLVRMN